MRKTPNIVLSMALLGTALISTPSCASAAEGPLQAYADTTDAGFSAEALEQARQSAIDNQSAAVMALYRGNIVAAWGAVDRPFNVHSIRKSLAGALYGIAIHEGRLRMDSTLATFGLEDAPPLNAEELRATFGDLIASRSGVYHGAAYAGADQESERPARGSHPPGTHWYYNNWDFNAAEAIYESRVGGLYEAFDNRIARAIGMEEFSPRAQFEVLEPTQSRMAAHTFRLSARDLARFGQLYLQQGEWGGRQIVPAAWVRDSLTPHSQTGEGTGYGLLWWTYDAGSLGETYPTLNNGPVYLARGSGGQALFILPSIEMVIAHLADTDHSRTVSGPLIWQLVERIAAARTGSGVEDPTLTTDINARALSPLAAPAANDAHPVSSEARARIVGEYVTAQDVIIRVFEFDRRTFINVPGRGEAELFQTASGGFTVRVLAGVGIQFQGDASRPATGVTIALGDQQLVGARTVLPGAQAAPARRRYGVSVAPPQNGLQSLTIQQVAAGSIAEERGVRAGDEIVALNGEPVATMSRETFAQHMTRSPLVMDLLRQRAPLRVELAFD